MSEAALVTVADLNHDEAYRELTRRAGGVVFDAGGITCWAGADPLPVLANGVVRTRADVPGAAVLELGRRFFAEHARGFSVILHGAADADLTAACEAAGLARMGDTPGMVLERRLADAVPPPGVTLARVETAADARDFARVNGEAYGTYGMSLECAANMLDHLDVVRAPHVVSMLARAGGVAASAAMVILTHGIGGIYWVGTTPAARGKGLAELCTRAVGNAAFDMGARLVVLQASIMGEPIYRRMGYREITRYPYYVQFMPPSA